MKGLALYLLLLISISGCLIPKCKDDMAFQFDRRGRPVKGKVKKDPPAFLMKRCPVSNCKAQKIHCHGNGKYRGGPWWKAQNPAPGQNMDPNMDK